MKSIVLMLVWSLIFSFSACTKKQEPSVDIPQSTSSPQDNKPKEDKWELISEYKTKIYDKIPERTHNLTIATKEINGVIIDSGKEFSFNNIVGERTAEKGYKEATSFDENGKKEKELGGGICQISSTIHMAAKNANLEITERHDHKNEIPYEKIGNDAAVSFGVQDFKFINSTAHPIKIEIIVEKQDYIIAKIYEKV